MSNNTNVLIIVFLIFAEIYFFHKIWKGFKSGKIDYRLFWSSDAKEDGFGYFTGMFYNVIVALVILGIIIVLFREL
jgi:hypothetical protein